MVTKPSLARRLFISACAATGTTNLLARWDITAFLPQLFVLRYTNMGGLDPTVFAGHVAGARSFTDGQWCAYWDGLAQQHLATARSLLVAAAGDDAETVAPSIDTAARLGRHADTAALAELVRPAAALFADHGPQASAELIEQIARAGTDDPGAIGHVVHVYRGIDAWVKAITYYAVSAFPGHTPHRTRAYWYSRRLSDALFAALAPSLGMRMEYTEIPVDGDTVSGYLMLPAGAGPHPVVLMTNGLEGTTQELLLPQLRYRDKGLGMFLMEMPGTYAYLQPMSADSETIYRQVIDHLAADHRIDQHRIAMVGVSFGGYWSTRMAANDSRLACTISCGAPTHHTFVPANSIGSPEIIQQALRDLTGARSPIDLARKLQSLSLSDAYGRIGNPIWAINGDTDTLVSTQDTIDIAEHAPRGELTLYPDDDHCAMGHYFEWMHDTNRWLARQLGVAEHDA